MISSKISLFQVLRMELHPFLILWGIICQNMRLIVPKFKPKSALQYVPIIDMMECQKGTAKTGAQNFHNFQFSPCIAAYACNIGLLINPSFYWEIFFSSVRIPLCYDKRLHSTISFYFSAQAHLIFVTGTTGSASVKKVSGVTKLQIESATQTTNKQNAQIV